MTTARRPLIAGNWKMNGLIADSRDLAGALAARMSAAAPAAFDMLVCPPFPLIPVVAQALQGSGIRVGAQDCHAAEKGAHTGDVSAQLLADLGCSHVILGHSERRADHGEDDARVRAKVEAAQRHGLVAIVCVGETEAERDGGRTLAVVEGQVAGSLPDAATAENTVIAYEPVWAIGTGRTPTNEDVAEVHGMIRDKLAARFGRAQADQGRLLYGGSMKPGNAAELMALTDVDGGLIGGASLKVEDFWGIGQSCP